jgi:phosphotransferase system  glucose/maltose/N-acetylglucosamine-specific IIC component
MEVPVEPGLKAGLKRLRSEVRLIARGASPTHIALRFRLVFLVLATLALDVVGTAVMYTLEHDNHASGFHTVFGAFFWVSAQLTTVSSQMPNPVTAGGKVMDLVLQAWAVSVVATLAASLASFFLARHHERKEAETAALKAAKAAQT